MLAGRKQCLTRTTLIRTLQTQVEGSLALTRTRVVINAKVLLTLEPALTLQQRGTIFLDNHPSDKIRLLLPTPSKNARFSAIDPTDPTNYTDIPS